MIHPLSGFLPSFTLFGVVVPTYFLVAALACIAALVLLVRRADRSGLSRNRALDVSLVLMITGFVGSRLFHVFFEEPAYYWARPWLVFDIWSGGFVWYGGALMGGVCSLLFLRWRREPVGPYLDLFAPVCSLGYAIGRVACVLAGCCYGRVVELPGHLLVRHPTQTYAVVLELLILWGLLGLERARPLWMRWSGALFFVWLALHACARMVMEVFRDDPRGPTVLGLSVSTCVSLGLLVLSVSLLAFPRLRLRFAR